MIDESKSDNADPRISDSDSVPYAVFASFYDSITAHGWATRRLLLEQAIDKEVTPPAVALDLACGTGSASLFLAQRGYRVVGVDLSGEMLRVARERVPATVELVSGDLRALPSLPRASVAVCCFDSLNYLLSAEDWQAALAGVRSLLERNGLFLFDVVTPHDHRECWPWYREVIERDGLVLASRGGYDEGTGEGTVRHLFFVRECGSWRRYAETHRQRSFESSVILGWLEQVGFANVTMVDGDTGEPAHESSVRWQFAARAR